VMVPGYPSRCDALVGGRSRRDSPGSQTPGRGDHVRYGSPVMTDQARESSKSKCRPSALIKRSAIDLHNYHALMGPHRRKDGLEVVDGTRGPGTGVRYEIRRWAATIGYILAYDYAGAPGAVLWTAGEAECYFAADGSYRFARRKEAGTQVRLRARRDIAPFPLPGRHEAKSRRHDRRQTTCSRYKRCEGRRLDRTAG